MKSEPATAEQITDDEATGLVDAMSWTRIFGDRHTTLALIPRGLSKQGWKRLADFCLKQIV
jgi:hypothetical protein